MSSAAVQPVEAVAVEAPVITKPADEVIVVPAEAASPAPAADPANAEKPAETGTDNEKAGEAAVPVGEKKEEKSAPHEITHGTLTKNSHGALLSFFKQKRFFYFQDDAISEDNLRLYLFKDSASKSNAAYALQTGKGLWFYTKDESRKDSPHGIIKLSDVTEVVENGTKQFVLKLPTGDLHFEAPPAERNNWVFTLKTKIEEAKTSAESIIESEGYKTTLERLNKPAATAKPVEKSEETKDVDVAKAEDSMGDKAETSAEAAVTSDEEAGPSETKDVKRSTSKKGKRSSKFTDFFGKKEKFEDKEAENKGETPADVATTPVTGEQIVDSPEEKKTEEESKAAEEPITEKSKPPQPIKRHSFFKMLKKDKEVTEANKDSPACDTTEGDAKAVEIPAVATEEKATTAATTSSPPKTKILAFLGKRDKSPSPKTPEEKPEAAIEAKPATPVEPAQADSAPAGDMSVEIPKDTVIESPGDTASPATKEKRKSFFSFKKEKKSEEVKSDTEETNTESTTPKTSTSPVPKGLSLTSLKRKVSRAGKGKETEAKEVSAPPAVAEEDEKEKAVAVVPETAEPVKPSTPVAPVGEVKNESASVIGDVVPDAVSVGQSSRPVQAAA